VAGEGQAEAAVGAGDEDGGVLEFHGRSFRLESAIEYDGHHILV
jgi:hypothetical protein